MYDFQPTATIPNLEFSLDDEEETKALIERSRLREQAEAFLAIGDRLREDVDMETDVSGQVTDLLHDDSVATGTLDYGPRDDELDYESEEPFGTAGESVTDSGQAQVPTGDDGEVHPHPGSEPDSGRASALSAGMHGDVRPTPASDSELNGSFVHPDHEDVEANEDTILYSPYLDHEPTEEEKEEYEELRLIERNNRRDAEAEIKRLSESLNATGVEHPRARYLRFLREQKLPLRAEQRALRVEAAAKAFGEARKDVDFYAEQADAEDISFYGVCLSCGDSTIPSKEDQHLQKCKVLRQLREAEIEDAALQVQSSLYASSVPGVVPELTQQSAFTLRDFCSYPLCKDRTGHTTRVCPVMHARCAVCKCRGHRAETEEKREFGLGPVCPKNPRFNTALEAKKNGFPYLLNIFETYAHIGLVTRLRKFSPAFGFWPVCDPIIGIVLNEVGYDVLAARSANDVNRGIDQIREGLEMLGMVVPEMGTGRANASATQQHLHRRVQQEHKASHDLSEKLRVISDKRSVLEITERKLKLQRKQIEEEQSNLDKLRAQLDTSVRNYGSERTAHTHMVAAAATRIPVAKRHPPSATATSATATQGHPTLPPYPGNRATAMAAPAAPADPAPIDVASMFNAMKGFIEAQAAATAAALQPSAKRTSSAVSHRDASASSSASRSGDSDRSRPSKKHHGSGSSTSKGHSHPREAAGQPTGKGSKGQGSHSRDQSSGSGKGSHGPPKGGFSHPRGKSGRGGKGGRGGKKSSNQ